ncbi:MAG TPA: PEP/pyruvate-binding domain-containing protein [Nitrospirota bacterium]|nr:PEP/pyruvate-binding domain-containing protein [Nitrospirota bacterium]
MKSGGLLRSFLASVANASAFRKYPADPEEFKAVFDQFKKVLDSNNRALETITDMGEKLSGDYLFDVNYIKKAYSRLRKDLEYSIRNFDTLTRNRYLRLHDVFGRIDSLIQQMISGAPPVSQKPVLFFEDIPWGMLREVGGKNAHLSEVKNRLSLRVPDAFVITTAAFDEFMRSNGLDEQVARIAREPHPSDTGLRELQELIIRGTVPPSLNLAMQEAIQTIRSRNGECFLAVRSSAEEEDSGRSFAGQFQSILNVSPETERIEHAYREVIASLFSEKAVAYQQQMGYEPGRLKMAVGCMVMVDAVSSGVMYTTAPDGKGDTIIISAAWGLGEAVVEGRTDADLYTVRKGQPHEILGSAIGKKLSMITGLNQGGVTEVATPDDLRGKPCLTSEQTAELASLALKIEKYFGSPRDIEWAIDKGGKVFILQARPLNIAVENSGDVSAERQIPSPEPAHQVLIRNRGSVVQKGTGAGKVLIARKKDDLIDLPKGAVLVAKHDSSLYVRVMPFVSAIITETGTQTSHMAALCRELKIPAIVNVAGVMEILKPGRDVTLVAGDDGTSTIYEGIVRDIITQAGHEAARMEDVYEYRRKRYILRYISLLNLVDPLMDEFTPEGCRTLHDILRFIHEKSVAELVDSAREGNVKFRKQSALAPLELPVPAGILVMDMGGGLKSGVSGRATFEQVTSVPFRAIIRGMIHPGAWHSEPVALKAHDFLSSMMRMPDIVSDSGNRAGYNVAVISREYVNLSIRFGYHFNMIDCYCGENAKNNHIYFRFVGGATDMAKRSRRVELIAKILREYGFNIKIKGDLLIARLAGLKQEEMETVLDQTGRLISYARQLDAVLHDDAAIDRYAKNFLAGVYTF